MPICFNIGQQLGPKDLYIVVRDINNQFADPYEIKYDIFDVTGGTPILMPPGGRDPERSSVGNYWVNIPISQNATVGEYLLQWRLKDTSSSSPRVIEQSFAVVGLDVRVTVPQLDPVRTDLVLKLRDLLRDNNPDRNYHFRPPTDREVIRGYTEKFGYIWEDRELLTYLELAADYVSLWPPRQYITLDTIPKDGWRMLILWQAAYLALQALTLNWIEEEFGYSIQGISLDIEKSQKYQSMADSLSAKIDSTIEQAKRGVKVTMGLQQNRFRVGAQGVLGPYTGNSSVNPANWTGQSLGRPNF